MRIWVQPNFTRIFFGVRDIHVYVYNTRKIIKAINTILQINQYFCNENLSLQQIKYI